MSDRVHQGQDVDLEAILNLAQLEERGRAAVSAVPRAYFAGGARDRLTLRANRRAFADTWLRPRMLRGVGQRSLATTVLGAPVALPVLAAPTAFQRLAHPDGELATARATRAAGTVMVLSTLATTAVEAVCAAGGTVWFQLYVYRDRALTLQLVQRARAAGCTALVVTVDAPVLGVREDDVVHRFGLPPELRVENVVGSGHEALPPEARGSGLAAYVYRLLDPDLDWGDLAWLIENAGLPVVVKGLLRADDAARAVELGAAGVIVSNHGGRQLDAAVPTLWALPEVVEAVGDQAEVYLDGGVRRGSDVLKALALGARAVLVGRPVVWGLGAGGEAGVRRAFSLLKGELDEALALSGCRGVDELGPDLISPRRFGDGGGRRE